jgi:hypothetical protein
VVYAKSDGDLLIHDYGGSVTATDRLVLTDLNASELQFTRVADSLVITVTANGHTIVAQDFFDRADTQHFGTDVIRFADGIRITGTPARQIGTVEARGAEAAIAEAIRQFDIPPEHAKRLAARRVG